MVQRVMVPVIAIAVSLLIRAELCSQQRLIYWLKPISTLLVIGVAALSFLAPGARAGYTVGVLVGLVLSLGGDVALMFPSARAFQGGLVLFLLAHVAYALTFTLFGGFSRADLIVGGALLILATVVYAYLAPGLGNMRGPVVLYILVISFMVNRAISAFFSPIYGLVQAWLIATGAVLFWISDLILAVNRFRRPVRLHPVLLVFYYGGQLLIAFSSSFFR
jgi:uncharacterized membrane protein YhhN